MNPLYRLCGSPWLIREDVFRAMCRTAAGANAAPRPESAARQQAGGGAEDRPYRMDRGVAVIDVAGPIYRRSTPYDDFFAYLFGGVSVDAIRCALRAAVGDGDASAILLNLHSPGGEAYGMPELAAEVRAASLAKPVAAYAEALCCSAAYYLAAAAGEITAGATAMVGSVGTVVVAIDDSGYQEMIGIKEIPIVSSQSPDKWPDPATDSGRALYQAEVDAYSAVFVRDVAEYRGTTPEAVLADFGRGWVKIGADAKRAGMVDKIGTYDDVISKLSGRNRARLAASRPAAVSPATATQGTAPPPRLRLRPSTPGRA